MHDPHPASAVIGIVALAVGLVSTVLTLAYWATGWITAWVDRATERDAMRDMPEHVRSAMTRDDIGELHERWDGGRDAREVAHDRAHDIPSMGHPRATGNRGGAPAQLTVGRARAARRARRATSPLATVTHGRYAGCRVRLLWESDYVEGLWFVEVVECPGGPGGADGTGEAGGVARGDRTVVEGGWLGDFTTVS